MGWVGLGGHSTVRGSGEGGCLGIGMGVGI